MSGVLAPSVCEVESAVDLFALLLVSPRSDLPPSRSSMTRSMGILPFRQEMYRWQKLSQSSWTWNKKKVKIASYRLTYRQTDSVLINNYKYIYQCIYRHHLIKWNKKVFRINFSYGQSAVSSLLRARSTYMIMNAAQINECVCCDKNARKRKCATKSAMGHTKLSRKSAINQFD